MKLLKEKCTVISLIENYGRICYTYFHLYAYIDIEKPLRIKNNYIT
jgi:hypothetical protein